MTASENVLNKYNLFLHYDFIIYCIQYNIIKPIYILLFIYL